MMTVVNLMVVRQQREVDIKVKRCLHFLFVGIYVFWDMIRASDDVVLKELSLILPEYKNISEFDRVGIGYNMVMDEIRERGIDSWSK